MVNSIEEQDKEKDKNPHDLKIQTPSCDNLAPAPPSEMFLTGGYPSVEVAPNKTQNTALQVIQVEPTASTQISYPRVELAPNEAQIPTLQVIQVEYTYCQHTTSIKCCCLSSIALSSVSLFFNHINLI
jgi:hypothetical protein